MIFAGFALRYLPRRAAVIAVLMVPLFSAPASSPVPTG